MQIKEYLAKVMTKEEYDIWIEPIIEHITEKETNILIVPNNIYKNKISEILKSQNLLAEIIVHEQQNLKGAEYKPAEIRQPLAAKKLQMEKPYGKEKVATSDIINSKFFTYPITSSRKKYATTETTINNEDYIVHRGKNTPKPNEEPIGQLDTNHLRILLALIHTWQEQQEEFKAKPKLPPRLPNRTSDPREENSQDIPQPEEKPETFEETKDTSQTWKHSLEIDRIILKNLRIRINKKKPDLKVELKHGRHTNPTNTTPSIDPETLEEVEKELSNPAKEISFGIQHLSADEVATPVKNSSIVFSSINKIFQKYKETDPFLTLVSNVTTKAVSIAEQKSLLTNNEGIGLKFVCQTLKTIPYLEIVAEIFDKSINLKSFVYSSEQERIDESTYKNAKNKK
jgi:hypothetical protein